MKTRIVEATNGIANWGKFLLARFDASELAYESLVMRSIPANERSPSDSVRLFDAMPGGKQRERDTLVLDLQTGEGAFFYVHKLRSAKVDLEHHKIWVCPLFEPFLEWLYAFNGDHMERCPALLDLPNAEFSFKGHRRSGPTEP